MYTHATRLLWPFLALGLVLTGCGAKEEHPEDQARQRPATLVSAIQAEARPVLVTETAVGRVEAKARPVVAAEVAGQVVDVLVDVGARVKQGERLLTIDRTAYGAELKAATADVRRIEAQLENQERLLKRYQDLSQDDFVSKTQLEDIEASKRVLIQQLEAARARVEIVARNLDKTDVVAPVDGEVVVREVSVGDYVRPGTALFEITAADLLQIILPYPEVIADRLSPGQRVLLRLNREDSVEAEGVVTEIRPTIDARSLSADIIVEVTNPGGWKPGASVDGTLILEERTSVVVPDVAVVQRPKGAVVDLIEGDKAVQRYVKTGVWTQDEIEITEGLEGGETVATFGAYYLTDGAPVRVKEAIR